MASWSRGPAVRVAVLFVAAASTTGASTTGAAFAFLPQPSTSADTVRDAEHLSPGDLVTVRLEVIDS